MLMFFTRSISPCEGEMYWPRPEFHFDPPPIEISSGRPRKDKIKDPFELPKKAGKLLEWRSHAHCVKGDFE